MVGCLSFFVECLSSRLIPSRELILKVLLDLSCVLLLLTNAVAHLNLKTTCEFVPHLSKLWLLIWKSESVDRLWSGGNRSICKGHSKSESEASIIKASVWMQVQVFKAA